MATANDTAPLTKQPPHLSNSPAATPSLHHNQGDPFSAPGPATDGPRRRVTVNDDPTAANGSMDSHTGSRRRVNTEPNMSVLRRVTSNLLTPERPVGPAPTWAASAKAIVFSSWVNILLIFIPVSWALYFVKQKGGTSITDTAVFCTSFIAIIPLAGLLGFATEEAALRLGQTLGGLLNATLGNVVELLVAILALVKCELAVVQSSLVGSILSNLLLVLGMCFFAGGIRFSEQSMKSTAAQLNMSLLLIAVIAVLVPSAFHFAFNTATSNASDGARQEGEVSPRERTDLLAMSHGVAVILLVIYVGFTIFTMWTHAHLYEDEATTSTRHPENITSAPRRIKRRLRKAGRRRRGSDAEKMPASTSIVDSNGADGAGRVKGSAASTAESDEEEEPQMNMTVTLISMAIIAALVGVTCEFLVSSIDGMVEANPSLSAEWVGLILLPIVGNAAEHFTAVSVSVKDKLDLSISVAVGSSIQIATFVIPVIQLLAWTIGKPMTLLFDPFEAIVLFLSVLIVNQTLADGRSNWMEGAILMLFYVLLAVAFWYYPGSATATLLGCRKVE